MDEKLTAELIQENIDKVNAYDFSGVKITPIPSGPCPRCNGRGYRKQQPGEYGLCPCSSCGGTGKQVRLRVTNR